MGFILQSDYVFSDFTSQGLDKVPVNARVRVGLYTYVLVKEGASATTTIQEGIDSGYLKQELNNCQSTYNCTASNNYQIFPSGWQGKVKITTYDSSNNVTGYFEVVNYNPDETNFEIVTAHFSNTVRQQSSLGTNSLILFLGWCFYSDGSYFGISVQNNTNINKIMIDTGECGISCQWTTKTYSVTNYIYAPRRGGGTYIQELGIKFECMRSSSQTVNGESYDFYKFINGFIEWNANMSINTSYYPQYKSQFHRLNIDPKGYFTRCLGGNASSSVGGVQGASAPNITGSLVTGSRAWTYRDTVGASVSGCITADLNGQASSSSGGGPDYQIRGFKINANLVDTTYQDGAELKPINFAVRWMVRCY